MKLPVSYVSFEVFVWSFNSAEVLVTKRDKMRGILYCSCTNIFVAVMQDHASFTLIVDSLEAVSFVATTNHTSGPAFSTGMSLYTLC